MLQCLGCFIMLLEWVLRASLAIVQCSAFSVVDLSIWYDLPLDLRSLPPGKVLHVFQVFLLQSFLGWDVDYVYLGGSPRLGVHLRTRALEGRSQNE